MPRASKSEFPASSNPAAPAGRRVKLKRDNGFRYKPRFGVIVEYPTEDAQRKGYESFRDAGLKARVVSV